MEHAAGHYTRRSAHRQPLCEAYGMMQFFCRKERIMERGTKKGKAARKQLFSLILALAMVLTSVAVPQATAEAAKNVKVKKIQITSPKKKTTTLVKGKTLQIKVKVTPKNAKNKKVTYKSSKKKIASVTSKGKVKGIKKGTAKITVQRRTEARRKQPSQ